MCGINGFNFVNRNLIKEMNDSISHRGPDAEGEYVNNGISLGHRRLAILDLTEKGKQPMTYIHGDKKVVIVFNGEIYNFLDIRSELENKGYKFRSNCDTEVIMASYLEWGFDCVKKFNGMWAFCLFDTTKNILFLSRDRFGKKPLHYYFDGKKFIFSSEIKAILRHNIEKTIDPDSVDLYFSLGFIPAPYTIYDQIKKLGARENLILNLGTLKIKKYSYYDLPNYKPSENKEELAKKTTALLKDAVKIRLISDVPLGAFLSGGLDSSAIVHEMTKQMDRKKLNTYSIGFEGKFDESKYINLVKDRLKTNHHHKYFVESDFKQILKEIFYYYDEPFADPSMFPSFFLTRFTRRGLTVSLSGDGGDEVFGGYPRYKVAQKLMHLRKIRLFLNAFKFIPHKGLQNGLKLVNGKLEDFYNNARPDFYKPKITREILSGQLSKCLEKTGGNLQEAVRLMDIYFYTLSENFLLKVDRASMANALEVRCPFLDHRLVELSMQIPSELKCSMFRDKILLRKILKGHLPIEIINRKKAGFTPPINKWIMNSEYIDEIREAIEVLSNSGVLSKEWKEFYASKIMKEDNLVCNNYKIRMFLFYRWYKHWII